MANYLVEQLNQKFEIRSFKVYFNAADSTPAETVLNALDRCGPGIVQLFGFSKDPSVDGYIYPDLACFDKVGQKPLAMGETVRRGNPDNVLLMCSARLPQAIFEEVSRNLGYLLFDNEIKEREISPGQLRTPSWLREGICLQVAFRARSDSNAFLLTGWTQLQEAEKKDALIKPSVMIKSISMIPDPNRRSLASAQSFYMMKFLQTVYPDKFVKKFCTLMAALDDMDGETAFRQITGFDFDKFFVLFKEWVHTTNIWAAVSD